MCVRVRACVCLQWMLRMLTRPTPPPSPHPPIPPTATRRLQDMVQGVFDEDDEDDEDGDLEMGAFGEGRLGDNKDGNPVKTKLDFDGDFDDGFDG